MDEQEVRAAILCPTMDSHKAINTVHALSETAGAEFEWWWAMDYVGIGFTKTANRLLIELLEDKGLTEVPYAVMINDDIRILESGWLSRMIEVMDTSPQYGMASPSGFCRTHPICTGKPGMEPKVHYVRQLPMFCTIMRVEMIRDLGLLDEGFIHYGSDSDYCERARQRGWYCLWIQDVFVHNVESPIREEWKKHDKELFTQKWGW